MKAFEEWDKKEYPLPPCYEHGPVGRDMLEQRQHTWRSALEMVKAEIFEHQDALEVIEKELEETE